MQRSVPGAVAFGMLALGSIGRTANAQSKHPLVGKVHASEINAKVKLNDSQSARVQRVKLVRLVDQLIASATAIHSSYEGATYVGRLRSGAYAFQSTLQLDVDGSIYCRQTPYGQPYTSLRLSNGSALDADIVPYVVLPVRSSGVFKGVEIGDVAVLIYHNKVAYAVVGDRGPANKLGEASLETFRLLGAERVLKTNHGLPNSSGSCLRAFPSHTAKGRLEVAGLGANKDPITTIVFPGTRSLIDLGGTASLIASTDQVAAHYWSQISKLGFAAH